MRVAFATLHLGRSGQIIKTAGEYTEAFAWLSALMDADLTPRSTEADELELLAYFIHDYEEKHYDLGLPERMDREADCLPLEHWLQKRRGSVSKESGWSTR